MILRCVLAEWLRIDEYDVVEAASGDEAAIILSSLLPVDLVVTDNNMPGDMSGLDLAAHIREGYPTLPVVVVSGRALGDSLKRAFVTAFFPKPYNLMQLSSYIATLLPVTEAIAEELG